MSEYVTVRMRVSEWRDLLVDLDWLAQDLDERPHEDYTPTKLEPGSLALIELLSSRGVSI